jgi:hypothetical protein
MCKEVLNLPLVFVVVFFFKVVKYILLLFALFVNFVCEHFIAKKGHGEHKKDDKELMIQDAKAKKEKCRKNSILTSIIYGCVFV